MEDESISTFASITGASPEVARGFLGMTGNDVERAIELFFENPELASSVQTGLNPSTTATAPQSTNPPNRGQPRNVGRRDSSGVIHIDSDDDNDMVDIPSDDDDVFGDRATAAQAAAIAQEEEDAAMAKRLQEELYGGGGPGGSGPGGAAEDDVRAPIASTTETLVGPDSVWNPPGGVGAINYESTLMMDHLRRQRQGPRTYSHISPSRTKDQVLTKEVFRARWRTIRPADMGRQLRPTG